MDSFQKYENAFNLAKPGDRSEIPIYLHLLSYPAAYAGMTQQQAIDDPKQWLAALDKVFEGIGKPDVSIATPPGDVIFIMGLESRRPGHEIGVNEQYQFIEKPQMDEADFHLIVKKGWNKWYNNYLGSIQKPPLKGFGLISRFITMGKNTGMTIKFLAERGVAPINHTACAPVFDTLSMLRSFSEFIYDLADKPGLVHDVLRKGTPEVIKLTITNAKRAKGDKVGIFAMRSDADSISPAIFDEFAWPHLKQMIEEFYKAGIRSVVHADSNWLPMLDRFLTLPKGSTLIELDGVTDIFKASEILEGHVAIRGDVKNTMLAFGTPDEVRAYCERLITEIGLKRGGFMLASGCEVPLNAKAENVKAMFDSLKG
jgi:uroporphyrinogen decarboxylase